MISHTARASSMGAAATGATSTGSMRTASEVTRTDTACSGLAIRLPRTSSRCSRARYSSGGSGFAAVSQRRMEARMASEKKGTQNARSWLSRIRSEATFSSTGERTSWKYSRKEFCPSIRMAQR